MIGAAMDDPQTQGWQGQAVGAPAPDLPQRESRSADRRGTSG